jgi:hypothetical protein
MTVPIDAGIRPFTVGTGAAAAGAQLRGANHYTPTFHDVVDRKWVSVARSPAGSRTVRAILDAIKANS